jgi:hypothetical protein
MAIKKSSKKNKKQETTTKEAEIIKWLLSCREEAEEAKHRRMHQNKHNFDAYHLRHDFSHKTKGQSREVTPQVAMSVEQISAFFQQALTDLGDWFKVDAYDQKKEELMKIRPHEIRKLTMRQLEKTDFYTHVGNGIKSGLLGGLIITKIHGEFVEKPKFSTKKEKKGKGFEKVVIKTKDKAWQLKIDLVRQENYYPDPTGEGLYEIEDMWMDFYRVKQLAQGDGAIYDLSAVDKLSRMLQETPEEKHSKHRETDQQETNHGHRGRVKITEYWGDVLDPTTGELIHENVVITMANDKVLLRKPTRNPNWHQKSPYVSAGLLNVPNAVWPKALMDAPTKLNYMADEIYNLIIDGAMKSVNAISQVRIDALADPSQVSDGIPAGTALKVNSKLPHGTKVAEPVITADVPSDAINTLNLVKQEFNAAALTSDARQGVASLRPQSATATVEASQTITSVFQGVSKNVEQNWIQPILEKSWMTIAQMIDQLDEEETNTLLGDSDSKQIEDSSPQEMFTSTVNGIKFRAFGIAESINKQQDFRKWTTLLQTISSSEVLIEAFSQKYGFDKLLGEIMTTLGIKKEKIELPQIEQLGDTLPEENKDKEPVGQLEGGAQPGATPDQFSQVPQAQAQSLDSILGQTAQQQGGIPQTNFGGGQ